MRNISCSVTFPATVFKAWSHSWTVCNVTRSWHGNPSTIQILESKKHIVLFPLFSFPHTSQLRYILFFLTCNWRFHFPLRGFWMERKLSSGHRFSFCQKFETSFGWNSFSLPPLVSIFFCICLALIPKIRIRSFENRRVSMPFFFTTGSWKIWGYFEEQSEILAWTGDLSFPMRSSIFHSECVTFIFLFFFILIEYDL